MLMIYLRYLRNMIKISKNMTIHVKKSQMDFSQEGYSWYKSEIPKSG